LKRDYSFTKQRRGRIAKVEEIFMYRRRILCTFYALLISKLFEEKGCMGEVGGGGGTLRTSGGGGHFRDPKSLDFQGPPLPMPLVMALARLKTIMYRTM
jgi:hypothetical protein